MQTKELVSRLPSFCGLELDLLFLIPDLFVACFDFTVDVREGAIMKPGGGYKRWMLLSIDFASAIIHTEF